MRIPSGDLAPMRKRRRGYPGYGRRRRHRLPVAAGLVVLLVLAGIGYVIQRDDADGGSLVQPVSCPSSAPTATAPRVRPAALPVPAQVQLRLFNGTGRGGLARAVGNELARRGFRVTSMGNAPKPLNGASRIVFGPGGRPSATLVAAHIMGARLVPVPAARPGLIEVTLGSSFLRLRTGPEIMSFVREPARPAARATKQAVRCAA